MAATDLLAAVADVFAANARRRADRAHTALSTLSRYERRIAREAAVMGYVLGHRTGLLDARVSLADATGIPGDAEILRTVIEHCDSTSDLYPYLAAACAGRRRRITKARLWPTERTEGAS